MAQGTMTFCLVTLAVCLASCVALPTTLSSTAAPSGVGLNPNPNPAAPIGDIAPLMMAASAGIAGDGGLLGAVQETAGTVSDSISQADDQMTDFLTEQLPAASEDSGITSGPSGIASGPSRITSDDAASAADIGISSPVSGMPAAVADIVGPVVDDLMDDVTGTTGPVVDDVMDDVSNPVSDKVSEMIDTLSDDEKSAVSKVLDEVLEEVMDDGPSTFPVDDSISDVDDAPVSLDDSAAPDSPIIDAIEDHVDDFLDDQQDKVEDFVDDQQDKVEDFIEEQQDQMEDFVDHQQDQVEDAIEALTNSDDDDNDHNDDNDDNDDVVEDIIENFSDAMGIYSDNEDSDDMSEHAMFDDADDVHEMADSKDTDDDDLANPVSWFNFLLGGDDETEDAMGAKSGSPSLNKYLGKMSRVQNMMDAWQARLAGARATNHGTCPLYPVQVEENTVTVTTQQGCKIVIRLKGVEVAGIDGFEDNLTDRQQVQRSVQVSYVTEGQED